MPAIPADCLFILLLLLLMVYMKISGEKSLLYRKFSTTETMKYILVWNGNNIAENGQETFIKRNCSNKNCFLTTNRKYLDYVKHFDAILYNGKQLSLESNISLPHKRSPRQVYIFWSMESAHNYPIKSDVYNEFFNWTFTFRLDSDLLATYIIVKDIYGNVVGPNENINWIKDEEMWSISPEIKTILSTKTKAVAWIVSNCHTKSRREEFVKMLQSKLSEYNLYVDIFGNCGTKCDNCWEMIQSTYYYYLSFENSFNKDYVTEKLLNPLKHYTVPIVYGTANYSRFLPRGAYLNAVELGVTRLVEEMVDCIRKRERYYRFFKWHNHYTFHSPEEDPATDNFCRLCAALNQIGSPRTQYNFSNWWNVRKTRRLASRNCEGFGCLL